MMRNGGLGERLESSHVRNGREFTENRWRHKTPKGTHWEGGVMRYDTAMARFRGVLAVELRAEGYSYDDLAEILGYTHRSAARKAVMRTLASRTDIAVHSYLVNRLLALDQDHRRSWVPALNGDSRALARCLRVGQERINLLGMG